MYTRRQPSYLLMTGATGLLGEYLIRDLLCRGESLAVLVRPSRGVSARQRIESICHRWQRLLRRPLPRPVVLEGQLGEPGWGLTSQQQEWVKTNCRGLLNNAASLQFVADDPQGEPWLSNLVATEQLVELARRWDLVELHHVSTAYICGRRSGLILETELDLGQQFGNDYEASKCAAELLLQRHREQFDSLTVYRPAIIVGDYASGYTSSFHGLYAPLKIAATLFHQAPMMDVPKQSFVEILGLTGTEEKNFVPVDWVSDVISSTICDPALHNQTLHLTPDHRTSCSLLADVIRETFTEYAIATHLQRAEKSKKLSRPAGSSSGLTAAGIQSAFRSQMEIYQAYWRDDPVFDRTQCREALPDRPPPPVDADCIRRLCRFALKTNFGWPRPPVQPPRQWAAEMVHAPADATVPTDQQVIANCNLRVLGEGGGDFAISFDESLRAGFNGGEAVVTHGCDTRQNHCLVVSTATLQRLISGELLLSDAVALGAAAWIKSCVSEASLTGRSTFSAVPTATHGQPVEQTGFDTNQLQRWIATVSAGVTPASSLPR